MVGFVLEASTQVWVAVGTSSAQGKIICQIKIDNLKDSSTHQHIVFVAPYLGSQEALWHAESFDLIYGAIAGVEYHGLASTFRCASIGYLVYLTCILLLAQGYQRFPSPLDAIQDLAAIYIYGAKPTPFAHSDQPSRNPSPSSAPSMRLNLVAYATAGFLCHFLTQVDVLSMSPPASSM